jgi:hypothetical protein
MYGEIKQYPKAGIQECHISEVEFVDGILKFTVVQSNDSRVIYKEFEPSPKFGEETFKQQTQNFNARMQHIASTLLGNDYDKKIQKSSSFAEYCNNFIEALRGHFENVPLRMKFVFNKKGYITLPRFTSNGGFIELASVNPTKLRITSFDTVEQPDAEVEEAVSDTY